MRAENVEVIRQYTYKRMRWKNGAGWTTEIALENGDDNQLAWRVSIAEIDADSDFSIFPNVDRTLLVLSGNGMILDFASGGSHTLRALGTALVFPGETLIRARLIDGPTRDFNVMTRRTAYLHALTTYRSGMPVRLWRNGQKRFFVYVVDGETLGARAGDSFLVPEGPETTIEFVAEGTLIVVELHRRGAP